MRAGPSNERGESSSSLSTTVSSSRHTGTRSAVRTPPATTTSPSTHASRRSAAPRSTHAPSAAPAASANPTDGRYNVRSATNTPAGYNRFATGNKATPIHPSPNASTLRPRRHARTSSAPHPDPAPPVERHPRARRSRQANNPAPGDECRNHRPVFLAQQGERARQGTPADAIARQRGIHGEHGE